MKELDRCPRGEMGYKYRKQESTNERRGDRRIVLKREKCKNGIPGRKGN